MLDLSRRSPQQLRKDRWIFWGTMLGLAVLGLGTIGLVNMNRIDEQHN